MHVRFVYDDEEKSIDAPVAKRFILFKHILLVEELDKFGYFIKKEPSQRKGGECAGITQMWVQSVLVNQENLFFDRIRLIFDWIIPEADRILAKGLEFKGNESNRANELIARLRKNEAIIAALKSKGQTFADVLAFFDGIILYNEPHDYEEIFGRYLQQRNITEISNMVTPLIVEKEMKVKGSNISGAYSEPGIYNKLELTNYFKALSEKIIAVNKILNNDSSHPQQLAITLSNSSHRIGLRYDIQKDKWIVVDPNQLPFIEASPATVAAEVINILGSYDSVAFCAKAFIHNCEQKEAVRKIFTKFKDSHPITEDKARRTTYDNLSLAYIAAAQGDCKMVKELLALGADFNLATASTQTTPILIAAQNGFDDVVDLLVKSKQVNFLKQDCIGMNAIGRAVESKSWKSALVMLLEIDAKDYDKFSIVSKVMIRKHREPLLTAFIEYVHQVAVKDRQLAKSMVDNVLLNRNSIGAIFREEVIDYNYAFFVSAKHDSHKKSKEIVRIEEEFKSLLTEPEPQADCCWRF